MYNMYSVQYIQYVPCTVHVSETEQYVQQCSTCCDVTTASGLVPALFEVTRGGKQYAIYGDGVFPTVGNLISKHVGKVILLYLLVFFLLHRKDQAGYRWHILFMVIVFIPPNILNMSSETLIQNTLSCSGSLASLGFSRLWSLLNFVVKIFHKVSMGSFEECFTVLQNYD